MRPLRFPDEALAKSGKQRDTRSVLATPRFERMKSPRAKSHR
ncbi:hypothetical protein PLCT2_00204 [Planctomycetaceae bacterium]|nr:hypothetical protein PLCT2_00204 [Planctomycetaceae bacterium]